MKRPVFEQEEGGVKRDTHQAVEAGTVALREWPDWEDMWREWAKREGYSAKEIRDVEENSLDGLISLDASRGAFEAGFHSAIAKAGSSSSTSAPNPEEDRVVTCSSEQAEGGKDV